MAGPTKTPLPPDTRLTLLTLGGWGLSYAAADQALTPVFGPSKPTALLVYLAIAPGRTARREHLLDLLWADLDPDAAAHALRQTIWYIRQRTTAGVLDSENGSLLLGVPVDLDRDRFLDAVARQDVESAVALYAGDFLPGFAAPGGADFEKWADLERHRLRAAFVRCAEAVCYRQLTASRFREAIALARRVRDADPLVESGWRLLLEALTSANDPIGAAAEASALERLLAEEDRELEPATRTALRAARLAPTGTDVQAAPTQLVAELVGREREFGVIVEAWADVQRGRVRHVHVNAPAGLGKSRLLSDAFHRLRGGGARAVLLRANPGERHVPFAFAADLAAAIARLPGAIGVPSAVAEALVGLNPSLSDQFPNARPDYAAGSDAVRLRTIALEETLRAAAEDAPVALLVDDLHWLDPASTQVLAGLITRLERERVLVVTTSRPTGDAAPARPDSLQLTLTPLDVAQVHALVISLGTLPDDDWARELAPRLHGATRGFPLLLLETLRLALDQDAMSLKDGAWSARNLDTLRSILASGSALRRRVEELTREQRWLLLVMATAGRALTLDVFRDVSPRPDESLLADLKDMEQRGLARSVAGSWLPGHDAVAETACELATTEALLAAHSALGRSYARRAASAPGLIPLAAQHLVAADDLESAGPLFALAVRLAATRGDRRPLRALAHELLGEHGTAERAQRLWRLLPLRYRAGLTTPARTASAVALAAAVLGVAAWGVLRPAPPPPDATLLLRISSETGAPQYRALPLRQGDWQGGRTVEVEQVGSALVPPRGMAAAESLGTLAMFTDAGPGLGWFVTLAYPDSGGQDIALADTAGRLVRLTFAPGDDAHGTLSPDRLFMVFSTSVWNPRMLYDIAVMDLRTRRIRQLTSGNDHDHTPLWSPDGTRIAFARFERQGNRGTSEVCVMTASGTSRMCTRADSGLYYTPLAWRDTTSLLVMRNSGMNGDFGVLDFRNGRFTVLGEQAAIQSVSPDGAWAARYVTNRATGLSEILLFPVARPRDAIRLTHRPSTTVVTTGWELRPRNDYVNALVIDRPDTLRIGVPFRLRVAARLRNGQTTSPAVLDFASDDPAIVEVDSSGTLIARRSGATTIRVSAGGWRDTTVTVRTAPPRPNPIVLDERWESDSVPGWYLYGYPRPQLLQDRHRRVFWNAGDGNYDSGAFTLQDFDARSGLGVEAWISAPLDSGQWQNAIVRFSAMIDTVQVQRWNDRSGWLSANALRGSSGECLFMFPSSYSQPSNDSASLQLGDAWSLILRTSGLKRGDWFRARLQIFPDGRCGFAINGHAVAISDARLDLTRRYRANIYGASAWTRILFGPLQIWQGVRTDVDWTRIPTR